MAKRVIMSLMAH